LYHPTEPTPIALWTTMKITALALASVLGVVAANKPQLSVRIDRSAVIAVWLDSH